VRREMSTASEVVDQQLAAQLMTLTSAQKHRLLKKLIAKKPRKSTQSLCRPSSQPLDWKPKNVTTAKLVLSLIIDGDGVVLSNIEASNYEMKIMVNNLATKVAGTIAAGAVRSTNARTSMMCTKLLARCHELASKIKDDEQLTDVVFDMHDHRAAAGFTRSRGSGVACNKAGWALIRRAATGLRVKLESDSNRAALDQQRHEPDPKEWNEGTCEKCGCLTPYCVHCGRTWCVGCESPHCQA
jgi:hypothetical protein